MKNHIIEFTEEVSGLTNPKFEETLERVLTGEEISVSDGELLLQAEGKELQALIWAADELRRRGVGEVVTYVKNRNLNFTNVCTGTCKFCAFRHPPNDSEAYVLTHEEIASKVQEAICLGATEMCVQGGLHPEFGLENYLEIIRTIRKISPDIHIHAFSPAEIDHIAQQEGMSIEVVIRTLCDAGLNSVPGTAAEMLTDHTRSVICPRKISRERWVEIIKTCHRLGLQTTATMLYGTVETARERAEHIALIREIQRETGGFTEFVPLAFMPGNTQLQREGIVKSPPSIEESLRVHAVARLMLTDYIDNIQASWVKLDSHGAQLMLCAGANDLGGTLLEENITHATGKKFQEMTQEQLEHLIREIGRVPRQRTTVYKWI